MQWNKSKARDPVCGMYVDVDSAITRTVQGRNFYFCEAACAATFLERAVSNTNEPAVQAVSHENSGDGMSRAEEKVKSQE